MGLFDLFGAGKIEIKETGKKYRTIAKAIEAAEEGQTILIPPGIYKESFEINKKVNVEGDAGDVPVIWNDTVKHQSVITISAECSLKNVQVQGAEDCCPDSFNDAGAGAANCILINSACSIKYVKVCYSAGYGIKIENDGIEPEISNCTIANNRFGGISLRSCVNPRISECEIFENPDGIVGHENSQGKIENCKIRNNKEGVEFFGSQTTIEGCEIFENSAHGIRCEDPSCEKIINSKIENNKYNVLLYKHAKPCFKQCKIAKSEINIEIWDAEGSFEECDIADATENNVHVHCETSKPTFRNCRISSANGNGMFYSDHASGLVDNCQFLVNSGNGILVKDFANPEVIECGIFTSHLSNVKICENGMGKFRGCKIGSSNEHGFYVESNGIPEVLDCKVCTNSKNGILISKDGQGTFKDCNVFSNRLHGIEVKDCSKALFKGVTVSNNRGYGVLFVGEKVGGVVEHWGQPISSMEDCAIYENKDQSIKEINLAHFPDLTNVRIGKREYSEETFEGVVITSRVLEKGSDYDNLVMEVESQKKLVKQKEQERLLKIQKQEESEKAIKEAEVKAAQLAAEKKAADDRVQSMKNW